VPGQPQYSTLRGVRSKSPRSESEIKKIVQGVEVQVNAVQASAKAKKTDLQCAAAQQSAGLQSRQYRPTKTPGRAARRRRRRIVSVFATRRTQMDTTAVAGARERDPGLRGEEARRSVADGCERFQCWRSTQATRSKGLSEGGVSRSCRCASWLRPTYGLRFSK
jgi:hypothetical protein